MWEKTLEPELEGRRSVTFPLVEWLFGFERYVDENNEADDVAGRECKRLGWNGFSKTAEDDAGRGGRMVWSIEAVMDEMGGSVGRWGSFAWWYCSDCCCW